MKLRFFTFIMFFLFVLSAYSQSVFAQEIKTSQSWNCLTAEDKGMGAGSPPATANLVLSGKGIETEGNVYTAICAYSICTTTNAQIDKELFGVDNSSKFTQTIISTNETANGHGAFSVGITPIKVKATGGKIKSQASFNNPYGHIPYAFYGIYEKPEIILPMGQAGQQQGTFTFDENGKKCTSIIWDPYGRVFDSQSLEPIPNVELRILDKLSPEHLAQAQNNPQFSLYGGTFNFLVEPGTYYLRLSNVPVTHTFSSTPKLQINYRDAYSKRDGSNSIYKPDEAIVEKAGKPEHRDIPLDPGKNPPLYYPIKHTSNFFDQFVKGNFTQYGGTVSHPLSIVSLIGKYSRKEIARTIADKFGFWSVVVENHKIPQHEPLLTRLIKVNLVTGKADEKTAIVTTEPVFEPILRNLKGYVYDENKRVAANAKVTVQTSSVPNDLFFQTTTDSKGYIKLSSKNLPIVPFTIVVEKQGILFSKDEVKITTSSFAQVNKDYLDAQSVNLMKHDAVITEQSDTPLLDNTSQGQVYETNNNSNDEKPQGNTSVFFIAFFMVVLVVAVIYFVIHNKSR